MPLHMERFTPSAAVRGHMRNMISQHLPPVLENSFFFNTAPSAPFPSFQRAGVALKERQVQRLVAGGLCASP